MSPDEVSTFEIEIPEVVPVPYYKLPHALNRVIIRPQSKLKLDQLVGMQAGRFDKLKRMAIMRRQRASWLAVIVLLAPFLLCAQDTKPLAKEPVAVIEGKPVYEDELLPLMQEQLRQLRNQEYELKSRALERLIDQKLLAAAAQRKGVPVDKIIEEEVDSRFAEPTDAEVAAYYLGQKDRLNRPLDEVKTQLRQELKQARLEQARQDYMQRLWRDANVGILLAPPKMEVGYDPSRVRGDPNAPVTIIEFSDFQCPYCRQAFPILEALLAKYPGQVKLAYRDFPLRGVHPNAQIAAEAARCANEQGKFWEYHDLLFSSPDKLDRAGLLQKAQTLNLDQKSFESCLDTGKFRVSIDDDIKAGTAARVDGTPAFFINGVFLSGVQSQSVFEGKINAELARLKRQQEVR
jgi:protein-disulfide isomerase